MNRFMLWIGKGQWMDTRVDFFESLYMQLTRTSGEKPLIHIQLEEWAQRDKSRQIPRWMVFASAARKIKDGGATFAHAMRPFLPDEEFLLLQSGECNNDLAGAIRIVIDTIGTKGNMMATVISALGTALGGIATNWITAVLCGFYMWPEFLGLAPLKYWPTWSTPLIKAQLFAADHWLVVTIILLALIPLYFVLAPNWIGRGRAIADKFPPFSVYKGLQAVSLLSALAALVQGGTPVRQALINISEITPRYLRSHVMRMVAKYDASGANAIQSIRTGLFTIAMQDRIEDAARGQSFDEVLKQVGSRSTALLHRLLTRQVTAISGVFMVINLAILGYTGAVFIIASDEATSKAIAAETSGRR